MVNGLERLSESSNKGVQKAAKGALWKISGEEKHQQEAKQQTQQQDQQQDQQQAQQQTCNYIICIHVNYYPCSYVL